MRGFLSRLTPRLSQARPSVLQRGLNNGVINTWWCKMWVKPSGFENVSICFCLVLPCSPLIQRGVNIFICMQEMNELNWPQTCISKACLFIIWLRNVTTSMLYMKTAEKYLTRELDMYLHAVEVLLLWSPEICPNFCRTGLADVNVFQCLAGYCIFLK